MSHRILIILLISCTFGLVWTITSKDLRITLPNGNKLIGRYLRSYSGRPIKAFTSIPYAKPPLGNLRFKDPEPIGQWHGEYKAVEDGPMCPQRNPFRRSYVDKGIEDCLYLNVYAPHTFDVKKTNLPVLVYVHGGGLVCGTGRRSNAVPDSFLDHDVILVAFNYRLGPIGFLSTEDDNCSGNFGLKDQVLVLKWVQENIMSFGGDSRSVTIFGSSAGAVSVTYLMMSSLTEGLFFKAFAISGTNSVPWSQPARKGVAKQRAIKFAEHFNCYTPNDWPQTLECLRKISTVNITSSLYDFYDFDTDPKIVFTPVVEPDLPGSFITKHPLDEKTEKSFKIPFMTGVTHDEGLLKSAAYFHMPELWNNFANKLEHVLPIIFGYNHVKPSVQHTMTKQIIQFYFKNSLSRDKELNVTNLFGDGWFLSGMDSYLQMRLAHKNASPTYVYLWTHKTSISLTEMLKGDPETYYGISHGDELEYLFPLRQSAYKNSLPSKEDEEMRKSFTKLVVDFAQTGNPTPDSSPLPKWVETKEFPVNYYRLGNLHFDNKPMFGMESGGIFEDRAAFWRQLYENLLSTKSENDEL